MGSAASSPRRTTSPPPFTSADLHNTVLPQQSPTTQRHHAHTLHSPPQPAQPRPIPPTTAHPSGLGPDGLPITDMRTLAGSDSPSPGYRTDPRRKKSLELPDLASLALTPVSVPPPSAPRPKEKYSELTYGYPPGASNVTTPPSGRKRKDQPHTHEKRRASAPATTPPVVKEEDVPRPPSPGMGLIFSHLPTGLPEPEEEEELGGKGREVTFRWEGAGREVLLAGSFLADWQGRERLIWDASQNAHTYTLPLRSGLHRFKYIIDGDWRCSTSYETATDPAGNLINTLSVPFLPPPSPAPSVPGTKAKVGLVSPAPLVIQTLPSPDSRTPANVNVNANTSRQPTPTHPLRQSVSAEDALGGRWDSNPRCDIVTDAYSPLWTTVPPPILQSLFSSSSGRAPALPPPPALPRHLERVILNAADRPGGQADGEDNSILPLPNHVVLNHLTASAIRGGVMAVGITGRYGSKLVTTIYYRPVEL
ncbi:AMPKBI-domain-containing protein [Dacryopinax primogenitus]|uniref:AMPKBI-domain-containing protein n=1 Tax=Dacryopinax primogenitus (strain DJM 731) TaxID=1858805 RepID=M5GEL3_DACPD|nr:AMPKBI-domain-containing protein [Dacryopinax primogenitus]EJU03363.1 AMPKBI-domain-containing protein [Dacryopinax primogenitus]